MTDPRQAGGGAFLDLGTHALDSLLWLMGEPVVEATAVTGGALSSPSPVRGEEAVLGGSKGPAATVKDIYVPDLLIDSSK